MAHGGGHFASRNRLEGHRQGVETNHHYLIFHALQEHFLHGRGGTRIESNKDSFQFRISSQGVGGQLCRAILVPIAVVGNYFQAASFSLFANAILAGVTGLVTNAAAQDQDRAFAAGLFAEVISSDSGCSQVVGLDQRRDVGIINGGVHGDYRDTGCFGLVQGVFPTTRVGSTDDYGVYALRDGAIHGVLLRFSILHFQGQVQEIDAQLASAGFGGAFQGQPELIGHGKTGKGDRDLLIFSLGFLSFCLFSFSGFRLGFFHFGFWGCTGSKNQAGNQQQANENP